MIYKNAFINGKTVDIEVNNGKFTYIGRIEKDGFDLKNRKVFAGLTDIHSHGCLGYDTMDGNHLDEMIGTQQHNVWWENVLYTLSDKTDIHIVDVSGSFWAEVDYIEDYQRIKAFAEDKK